MNLRQCYAAVLIVVLFLSLGAAPVAGTVYPIDNSMTLTAFQNFLNTTSDGDTITFASGTYHYYNVEVLKNNLTFESNQSIGATTQNTIIDGLGGNSGIFWNISANGPTNLTFKQLTLRDGYSSNPSIGGALGLYSNTTVISSDFINDTTDNNRKGGAIWIHSNGHNLTVIGSNFTDCSAGTGGGALYTEGVAYLMVNSSSFTNCSVTGGAGTGGAIYASQGGIVNFCRFGNITSHDGSIIDGGVSGHANELDLNENWWGTNSPVFATLTQGHSVPASYLQLGLTATPTGITTAQTSALQANLSYDNTGTLVAGNILPDGIPVIFTIGSGPAGSAVSAGQVLTANHLAATTFSSPAAGTATVNASVDGFNVSVNVSVTAAASPDTGNGVSRTDYWVKTGTNDAGYQGTQPTLLGFGPSPTITVPPTPAPAVTPGVIPMHPVPVPEPGLLDRILAAIQEYFAWLVLIVIIIILVALLRRWWIRRQNPGLFRKQD